MKDLNKIISGLKSSGMLSGLAGGAAGGVLSSAIMGKSGRKMGKKAVKVGALAAVGGLAWKAYQSYSQNKNANQQYGQTAAHHGHAPGPNHAHSHNRFHYRPAELTQHQFDAVIEDEASDKGQMLLLRAMIAAAYADGHIDEMERQRIFDRVEQMDLSVADKASLFDELRRPLSLPELVAKVPNSQAAVEVYAASLLAIDEYQPASANYLQQLANQLCLPRDLVSSLHQQSNVI